MASEKELLSFTFNFEGLSSCPLCSGKVMVPNGKVSWLSMDFWYVLCPSCGLKFMNPRPTQESYKKFYRDYFWQQKIRNIGFFQKGQIWNFEGYAWDTNSKMKASSGIKNKKEKLEALRFKPIAEALRAHGKLFSGAHILEVGTSFPVTLNLLHEKYKVSCSAIEPSKEAQAEIKKHKHIKFLGEVAEDLEHVARGEQKFDAIIFSHSLENTVVPFNILACAKKALKKGGIIYVQCSNLLTYDQMNPYHPYIFSRSVFSYLEKKLKMKLSEHSLPIDRMLTVVFKK